VPCPSWVTDASTALDVTALLVAIATVLTAAELLALRAEFRPLGLFDPHVLSATRAGVLTRRLALVTMPRVAGVQLVLALSVILCLVVDVSPGIPLIALAATTMLRPYVLPYGADGADTMARLLTITAAIALSLNENSAVVRIALGFIAAQLCLAYGASGVAKLFGRPWRRGTAVPLILHTAFGHPGLLRSALDRSPGAGQALTWFVVGIEIAFPVGIVLGGWIAFAALIAIASLQAGIAVSMGLNRFTPWFFAAFPAAAWATCNYGVLST
jgi:hypothetical protein